MYSVEITVEKDKVTGETRVLSSTTVLPRERLPQGIKVYEDETKGTRPSPAPPEPEAQSSLHPRTHLEAWPAPGWAGEAHPEWRLLPWVLPGQRAQPFNPDFTDNSFK